MINHEVKNTYEKQKSYLRIDIQMSNPVSYIADLLQELFLELFEVQFHDSTNICQEKEIYSKLCTGFSCKLWKLKNFQ